MIAIAVTIPATGLRAAAGRPGVSNMELPPGFPVQDERDGGGVGFGSESVHEETLAVGRNQVRVQERDGFAVSIHLQGPDVIVCLGIVDSI